MFGEAVAPVVGTGDVSIDGSPVLVVGLVDGTTTTCDGSGDPWLVQAATATTNAAERSVLDDPDTVLLVTNRILARRRWVTDP